MIKSLFVINNTPVKYRKLKEKDITTRFGGVVRSLGGFFHKISDQSSDLKPCDVIVGFRQGAMQVLGLLELKQTSNKGKVDVYKLLRPNQIQGLLSRYENGGNGYVGVYCKEVDKIFMIDIHEVVKERILEIK